MPKPQCVEVSLSFLYWFVILILAQRYFVIKLHHSKINTCYGEGKIIILTPKPIFLNSSAHSSLPLSLPPTLILHGLQLNQKYTKSLFLYITKKKKILQGTICALADLFSNSFFFLFSFPVSNLIKQVISHYAELLDGGSRHQLAL